MSTSAGSTLAATDETLIDEPPEEAPDPLEPVEPPEVPELPNVPEFPDVPEFPEFPEFPDVPEFPDANGDAVVELVEGQTAWPIPTLAAPTANTMAAAATGRVPFRRRGRPPDAGPVAGPHIGGWTPQAGGCGAIQGVSGLSGFCGIGVSLMAVNLKLLDQVYVTRISPGDVSPLGLS